MSDKTEYKYYLAKKMNLEQIIERINKLKEKAGISISIDEYIDEFNKIEANIRHSEENGEVVPYSIFANQIEYIANEIDSSCAPLYVIYLHINHIAELLKNADERNIEEIVNETKEMRNLIVKYDGFDKRSEDILDKAFELIYNVMLIESIYGRYYVLNNVVSNDFMKEKISKLLRQDLETLSHEDMTKIELQYSHKELGYDFLNKEVVSKVASTKLKDKAEDYINRRKTAISYVLEKADEIKKDKLEIISQRTDTNYQVRKIKRGIVLNRLKFVSIIMAVLMAIGSGTYFGGKLARLYKKTTKSYNYLTNGKIGDETSEYAPTEENIYAAHITTCGPWRESITGEGYTRDVVSFDYASKEIPEKLDIDSMKDYIRNGYLHLEYKPVLEEGDSLEEPEIIIEETIQDKNDYEDQTIAFIGSGLLSILLAMFLDFLICQVNEDYEVEAALRNTYEKIESLKNDLKQANSVRVTRKVFRERIEKIGDKAVSVIEEIRNVTNRYQLSHGEIQPEVIENVRQIMKNSRH